jgi:hypothetical protein
LNFLDKVSKNSQKSNFMKIRPVEVELFHTGGQTYGRANRKKDRPTYRKGDREKGTMTNRKTDRHRERETDRRVA